MSAQKSPPLTKEEVMMLVELIESHPVLFSKATNASNNQLKEATWTKLTSSFNSMIASNPRKPEQLRLKWENLKKAARKRSTKIRMNNLKKTSLPSVGLPYKMCGRNRKQMQSSVQYVMPGLLQTIMRRRRNERKKWPL
ncbi:hypothetical protein ACJJTC_010539 [Scirpophaga incertulas]